MANDSNNDDLLFLNEKAGGGACTERSRGKGRSRGDKGQDGNKLVLEIQGKGQSEKQCITTNYAFLLFLR